MAVSWPGGESALSRALMLDRIRIGLKLAQSYSNRSQDDLAQAQRRKMNLICRKLGLQPGGLRDRFADEARAGVADDLDGRAHNSRSTR